MKTNNLIDLLKKFLELGSLVRLRNKTVGYIVNARGDSGFLLAESNKSSDRSNGNDESKKSNHTH